jgi:predicted phage-related endonuclease
LTDLTPTVTAFHEAAEWTGVRDDDRDAWLDARHEMVTASEVAMLLGFGRNGGPFALYVDKITPRGPQERLTLDDPRYWGKVLEQTILTSVSEYHGWNYRRGGALLRSRKFPWIGATLDAEVDRHDGKGWINFEGKTTRVTKEWNESEQDVPTHVLIQVQTQALVSQSPTSLVFALLVGSRPCQVEIEPDRDLHAIIVEESQRFQEQVRTLSPPDPDDTEASKRALDRLYPLDDGSVVRLPIEALDWTKELKELAKQQADLKKREDEIKNLIRKSIGNATYGVLTEAVDGRQFWRWQMQDRAEHTVKASSSRVLLAMKNGPFVEEVAALPAPSPITTIERHLQQSIESNVTPIARSRRRARR